MGELCATHDSDNSVIAEQLPDGNRLIAVDTDEVLAGLNAAGARELARNLIAAANKLHELRHTAASLAIQAGANIKALQNMLGHESAGLTLDRYGRLYGSDVEAVGVAINDLLTRKITGTCGHGVGTGGVSDVSRPPPRAVK